MITKNQKINIIIIRGNSIIGNTVILHIAILGSKPSFSIFYPNILKKNNEF